MIGRGMMAMLAIVTLTAVGLPACGDGGGGSGGAGGSGQTYKPPSTDDGTGKPSGATSYTCNASDDCGNWYCYCEDGGLVNSANCTNGYCLDAASQCPAACAYFDHGAWTGQAGGGPGSGSSSSSSSSGGAVCGDIGASCISDSDCCSAPCADDGYCGGGACGEFGALCFGDGDCCSGFCDSEGYCG